MRLRLPFCCLLILGLSGWIRAEDSSALINQELDKLVQIQVDGVLPQVLKTIEEKTGVPFVVSDAVYSQLPWGDQTSVSARVENQTLRQALTAITRRLGLTYTLESQAVRIEPMPALARLGRRSTVQELEALNLLSSTELGQTGDRATVQQIVTAANQKLQAMKSRFSIEFRPGGLIKPDDSAPLAHGDTIADALDSLEKETDATWYPWGNAVLLVPKEAMVRNQLQKTINTRFSAEDVTQVLAQLSELSGTHFQLEPGAIQRIPPEYRTITLRLENATVRDAMESLAGITGLGYVVKGGSVYIWNESPAGSASGSRLDPVIALLQLDNGMQVFLRDKDLPPDIREYAEHKKSKEFDRLRQMMKDENFHPSTQPTTKPAEKDL